MKKMATFQIHEDFDTENGGTARDVNLIKLGISQHHAKGGGGDKEKRQTFAVLNNISHGTRTHAQATVLRPRETNIKSGNLVIPAGGGGGKITDENDVPSHQMLGGGAVITAAVAASKKGIVRGVAVPVDQFKAFCVDENGVLDENQRPLQDAGNVERETDILEKSNASMSEIRQPLQEIKHEELLQTPVSIDILSPMSIDRSMEKCDISLPLKSERERFFEIEEYQPDVIQYLRESETKHLPKYGYMRKQPDINHSMRTILIDWLVEVCEEYRLHSETLGLAVSYIDRFLSKMSVVRAKLQLVGTAAMFIASKYEEIYPPDVGEFVYITDSTYTKQQVLRMEQFILKALTFDLCVPTTYTFITVYSTVLRIPDKIKFLALFIAELSLLDTEPYLQYLPSKISAAAIALALYNFDQPIWGAKFEEVIGYTLADIKDIILHLNRTHMMSVSLQQQAIQDKYKSSKFLQVSTVYPMQMEEEDFTVAAAKVEQFKKVAESNDKTNENVRQMISSLLFV